MSAVHGEEFYSKIAKLAEACVQHEGIVLQIDYQESLHLYQCWYNGKPIDNLDDTTEAPPKLVFEMEGQRDQPAGELPTGAANDTTSPTVPTGGVTTDPTVQAIQMAASSGAVPLSLPPEVLNTFAVIGTVTWTNRQAQNTLLAHYPLGPRLNPYTAHLSAMWGAWGGGIEIRVTVSGSGIFAGKLMMALVPPGVDVLRVANPGALPHALLDARTTDPVVFHLPDVRNTTFHLMDDITNVPELGIWIFNPLINPFSSNDVLSSCTLTIETRPSGDFQFGMLLPPNTAQNSSASPAGLLPRRLGQSRGNRTGRVVIGLRSVALGTQTNHHWNANGTTYGWSVGNPDTITVQTQGGDNTSRMRAVRGTQCPIVRDVANHWPDYSTSYQLLGSSADVSYNGTSNRNMRGVACLAYTMDGYSNNVVTDTAWTVVPLNGQRMGNDKFRPGVVVSAENQLIMSLSTSTLTGGVYLLDPVAVNGPTPTIENTCLTLNNASRVVGPIGTNNVLLWQESLFSDTGATSYCLASQLQLTAEIFSNGPVAIPANHFAVFAVSSSGGDWQLGISQEGFIYSGVPVGNSVLLPEDTTFTYVGLFPVNTPLQGFLTGGGHSLY